MRTFRSMIAVWCFCYWKYIVLIFRRWRYSWDECKLSWNYPFTFPYIQIYPSPHLFPLFYSHRWMKASWNPPFPDLQMYNIWHGMVWYVGFFPLFPWPLTGQSLPERRHKCTRLLTWLVRRDLDDGTIASSYVLSPYIFSGILRTLDEMCHEKSTGTVHPQNVQIQNVQDTKRPVTERPGYKTSRIQNVQLPNVQLQNVQDRIQNVQNPKRPVFVNCKLCTVHTEQGLSRHRDLKGDGWLTKNAMYISAAGVDWNSFRSSVCQSGAGTACIFTTSIKVQVMHTLPPPPPVDAAPLAQLRKTPIRAVVSAFGLCGHCPSPFSPFLKHMQKKDHWQKKKTERNSKSADGFIFA